MKVPAILEKRPGLKCSCGHRKDSHRFGEKECVGTIDSKECTCRKFRPVAGQRGLYHRAFSAMDSLPGYTVCRRLEPVCVVLFDESEVDCPECLEEMRAQECKYQN
jgi:hypothetical protein